MGRKPNVRLTLEYIQQCLAAYNKTGARADAPDNTVYELIHQLIEEGVAPSDEFEEMANEINLIQAHFARHPTGTHSGDLLMYVFQKICDESALPIDYLPLIKVFLRGNGDLLTRVLQILNQFLDKDKQVAEKAPGKAAAVRWEEIKQVFITYVYTHGDIEDKKFLSQYCYGQSYYQMLCAITASGDQWIRDTLKQLLYLPNELTNFYNAWRMSSELQGNARERVMYKIISRLANVYEQQIAKGNSSLLQSIPSDMFAIQGVSQLSMSLRDSSFFKLMSVSKMQSSASLLAQSQDPFVLMDRPSLPTSFQSVVDKMTALVDKIDASQKDNSASSQLDALNKDNLAILRNHGRRLDDAKNHDYYTVREVECLKHAKSLVHKPDLDKKALKDLMDGVHIKIRHQRYTKEIARLNDPTENIFDLLSEREDKAKVSLVPIIKSQWERRASFASLDSSSVLDLLKNLEQVRFYINHASEEIGNDPILTQGDWLSVFIHLQELQQLVNLMQVEVIDAMLERLKLVPAEKLTAIDEQNIDDSYADDLVYHTLKSLIDCGLSERYVAEFAYQTKPTNNLTVALVKQFRDSILSLGTAEQKAELEEMLNQELLVEYDPAPSYTLAEPSEYSVVIPKELAEICSKEKEKLSQSCMQESGWHDLTTGETYFPIVEVQVLNLEETEIGNFYELLPEPDLSASSDKFDVYLFNDQEDEAVLAEAQHLFAQKFNQQFFVEKVKTYLLHHPGAKALDLDCLDFAYDETAKYLIQYDARLFDNSPLAQAKSNFMILANQQAAAFGVNQHNKKFEEMVLNHSYEAVCAIEGRANEVFNELCTLNATPESLKMYRETFIETAYDALKKEGIKTTADGNVDVEEAKLLGKKAVFILRHVRQIPTKQQALYRSITERCIANSGDPSNIDNWEKSLEVAQKVLNFIAYLEQEAKRIREESPIKFFFMSSTLTKRKLIAYQNKITQLEGLKTIEEFTQFSKNIEKDLIIERNLLSFRGTSSDSEFHLRRYFCHNR